jgi:glutaredoxin
MPQTPAQQFAIKIYTTSWCNFCKAEKKFLSERNIPYTDVDVEADEAAGRELVQLSGQLGVPFTVITKPDGTHTTVLGFDQPRLTAELNLS